jgi:predicted SAM-dependent methyltransferase
LAKYLNVGGGNFRMEDWINLDCEFDATKHKRDWGLIDINHNLMSKEAIPVESESIDAVYSEHSIEHLTESAVEVLFEEAYRMLKYNGVFRVSCPDADWLYARYFEPGEIQRDFPRSKHHSNSKEMGVLDIIATPMIGVFSEEDVRKTLDSLPKKFAFDEITESLQGYTVEQQLKSPGDHLSWWNHDKIRALMFRSGFEDIKLCARNESRIKIFRKGEFDRTAYKWSVRVEASKLLPGTVV